MNELTEDKVRAIIRQEITAREGSNAFGVSLIPFHRHTGIDGPQIQHSDVGGFDIPKIASYTSTGTITPNTSLENMMDITALAVTGAFQNPIGSPQNGQVFEVRIASSNVATARALTFSTSTGGYAGGSPALPSTTVTGQTMMLGFQYDTNGGANKWRLFYSSSA